MANFEKFDKNFENPDSKFTNQGYTKQPIPTSMMELYDRDIGDEISKSYRD